MTILKSAYSKAAFKHNATYDLEFAKSTAKNDEFLSQAAFYADDTSQLDTSNLDSFLNSIPMQFAYERVDASLADFIKEHSPDGWEGRKLTAIPRALFSAVIQSIYHLTKTLFFCIAPQPLTYVKAQLFSVARDFQEAFGWLISLYRDEWGQYHIQQSQFYKDHYHSKSLK